MSISRDFVDAVRVLKQIQYVNVPPLGIADGIDASAKHAKMGATPVMWNPRDWLNSSRGV